MRDGGGDGPGPHARAARRSTLKPDYEKAEALLKALEEARA